jgi:SSS family solute:Na+ symporter
MSILDWIVLTGTMLAIVIYGAWKTRGPQNMQSYLLGDNEAKWWTIGFSVMATQASAITFMSTPGQAFHDGMGFVQFYFGLPFAMVIICISFIPIYHRLKVYTAYEYLEQRFDLKTRSLTAFLFLFQRGLGAGITIYAPAIILSTILGWNLNLLNGLLGGIVVLYTIGGGSKAVNATQQQQMFVIMAGMFLAFFTTMSYLPEQVGFSEALSLAGSAGKLNILDFSFDPESRYTFWSGITGGLFLALAYFGTDQSQVQRYLSGKSVRESQLGLIFNGLVKVPMQFFILFVGVMVFVFYQFNPSPVFFNEATVNKLKNTEAAPELQMLQSKNDSLFQRKRTLAFAVAEQGDKASANAAHIEYRKVLNEEKTIRNEVKELVATHLPAEETNDKDYVFINYILAYLPKGLIGLLLAVIFSAAMSSTASELSALATTSTIDIYKRSIRPGESDTHYLTATRWMKVLWGAIAITFACAGSLFENLIQFVNIVGSVFYGTILGIFLVALYFKKVRSNAVFYAALLSETLVLVIFFSDVIGYLWLNFIGCVFVILFSHLFGGLDKSKQGHHVPS